MLFFTAILLERISKFKISISAMKLLAVRTQNKIFLFRKSSVRAGCCDLMLSLSLSLLLSSSLPLPVSASWQLGQSGQGERRARPRLLSSPSPCSSGVARQHAAQPFPHLADEREGRGNALSSLFFPALFSPPPWPVHFGSSLRRSLLCPLQNLLPGISIFDTASMPGPCNFSFFDLPLLYSYRLYFILCTFPIFHHHLPPVHVSASPPPQCRNPRHYCMVEIMLIFV